MAAKTSKRNVLDTLDATSQNLARARAERVKLQAALQRAMDQEGAAERAYVAARAAVQEAYPAATAGI